MRRTILSACLLLFVFAVEASAVTIYGVNTDNRLIRFDSNEPGTLTLNVAITGVQPGEQVVGIDFRPSNRLLYALGGNGRLYRLNPATGAATFVAALTADPADASSPFAGLVGSEFGFDFNPATDRIRLVSDAEQNLRINPNNGTVITDGPLAFAGGDENDGDDPTVTAIGHHNNFPDTSTTNLYGIDATNNLVVLQDLPNDGTLTTTSTTFFQDIEEVNGLDFPPGSNSGFGAVTLAGETTSTLFSIPPGFCCPSSFFPNIGGGARVRGITVQATSFFRLSAANYVVDEAAGTVAIPVFRFGDTSSVAEVRVRTEDGTALAPFDYFASNFELRFEAGETVRIATISIVNNAIPEGDENFIVALSDPSSFSSPVTLDTPRRATVTITEGGPPPPGDPEPVTIFGVSLGNRLFSFRSTSPNTIDYSVAITGLQPDETLLNIDVRPSNDQLYALGSSSRLYTLNTTTGAATLVAALTADPADGSSPFAGLVGVEFGFDFNPAADRIRIVSDADQNLRVNPDDGTVITDGPLAYAAGDPNAGRNPAAVAAAYSNPDTDPSTGTTLYVIEAANDMLVTQNPPNNGTLNVVGPTLNEFSGRVGFDIAPDNTGYASLNRPGENNFFLRIDLATGAASGFGFSQIDFPDVVRDIAVAPGTLGALEFDQSSYTVSEGDGTLTATVVRTGGSSGTVSVNFSTNTGFGNNATPGEDFTPVGGTLTFGPGETSKEITVPILDDDEDEFAEQFLLMLSGPTGGAALGNPSAATVNITDNDGGAPPGQLSISVADVTVEETDAGTIAVFDVTLSEAAPFTASAQYITSNGTAAAGADFTAVSGTVIFSPGQTTRTITVPINGDDSTEPNETFFVNLSNPNNAVIADAQAQGTITDDDAPTASFAFGSATFADTEHCGEIVVTVNRTGDTSGAMTVDFVTSNGTASDRSDYTFATGTLEFAAGETSKTFPVLISEDSHVEGTESLTVTLSNPGGGGGLGSQSTATVVIIDDAAEPATNPIDESETFVCQHYHDFLNREPDAAGLNFWTNNIESCGNDAVCRENKRVDTSAAFFLSIEFQETGYLVERAYRAAFNRRVLIGEFLPDTQRLGRGVVVGQPGWPERLEANKQTFFDAFVARPEFTAAYGALTNAQFVDALNANTGGALSQAERDALVAALNANTRTRAQAVRSVVEDATFAASEFNRAFVLMQYFGYLRRDPDEPGFNFWLNKLNQFNGDFRAAEMVKAFLVSIEYRQRFGQ